MSKVLDILGSNGQRWLKDEREVTGPNGEHFLCLDNALMLAYPTESLYNEKAEGLLIKIGKDTSCPHKWVPLWNDDPRTHWAWVKSAILAAGV